MMFHAQYDRNKALQKVEKTEVANALWDWTIDCTRWQFSTVKNMRKTSDLRVVSDGRVGKLLEGKEGQKQWKGT